MPNGRRDDEPRPWPYSLSANRRNGLNVMRLLDDVVGFAREDRRERDVLRLGHAVVFRTGSHQNDEVGSYS